LNEKEEKKNKKQRKEENKAIRGKQV
jgi:hypothetical protein